MMNRLLALLLCLAPTWGQHLVAQGVLNPYRPASDSTLGRVEVGADAWIQSQGMDTRFINMALFKGGELSQSFIDKQLERMDGDERIALHGEGGIRYYDLGRPLFGNWDWMVDLGYTVHSSLRYPKDMFELTFKGNSAFQGSGATLTGTRGTLQSAAHVGFGFHNQEKGLEFALNFMIGDRLAETKVDYGVVETADDASYITAQMRGEVVIRDTSINTFTQLPGWGFTVDARYRFQVDLGEKRWPFLLEAHQVGFMRWNDNTQHYSMDTTVVFQGLSQDQLVDVISGKPLTDDLMDTLGIRVDKSREYRLFPGSISISKQVDLQSGQAWQSYFGVSQVLDRNALPFVWAGSYYQPVKWFALQVDGGFGGYGGIRVGVGTRFYWRGGSFAVRCGNVYGLFPSANGWAANSVLSIDL